MTNEKAIEWLKWHRKYLCDDSWKEIYDMAIEALKNHNAGECDGCVFVDEPWDTTPCGYCMRSHKDLYVRSKGEE